MSLSCSHIAAVIHAVCTKCHWKCVRAQQTRLQYGWWWWCAFVRERSKNYEATPQRLLYQNHTIGKHLVRIPHSWDSWKFYWNCSRCGRSSCFCFVIPIVTRSDNELMNATCTWNACANSSHRGYSHWHITVHSDGGIFCINKPPLRTHNGNRYLCLYNLYAAARNNPPERTFSSLKEAEFQRIFDRERADVFGE